MIVAGFGFRAGATLASLQAALALAQEGQGPVTCLATVSDKIDGLRPLSRLLDLPLTALTPEELASVDTVTHSAASHAAYGIGSVAEASALAAAGPGARLLTQRQISPDRMATCALAQGPMT